MHMSPVLPDMQAFAPLDGVDSRYGQVYHPIDGNEYKQGGIVGFLSYNTFKGFKYCRDAVCMAPALIAWSCPSAIPLPVIPCLDKLNNQLLEDNSDSWTEEELEAAMFSPEPSCLDIQAMPTMKPKPTVRPTIDQLHAKLINGCDNLFFVAVENE